jgi:hypothetical protein
MVFTYEIVLQIFHLQKCCKTKFQLGHIHFSGVNDPAEIVSEGSMTPLKSVQQGQWGEIN